MAGSLAFACAAKSSGGGKRSSVLSSTSRSFSCSTVSVWSAISPSYRLSDLLICLSRVSASEHGGSGNEQGCTRPAAARGSVSVNTAVHFERQPVRQQLAQALELAHGVLDERLAAPAGIHGHAEQRVELVEDVGGDLGRGGGGQREAGEAAGFADRFE